MQELIKPEDSSSLRMEVAVSPGLIFLAYCSSFWLRQL